MDFDQTSDILFHKFCSEIITLMCDQIPEYTTACGHRLPTDAPLSNLLSTSHPQKLLPEFYLPNSDRLPEASTMHFQGANGSTELCRSLTDANSLQLQQKNLLFLIHQLLSSNHQPFNQLNCSMQNFPANDLLRTLELLLQQRHNDSQWRTFLSMNDNCDMAQARNLNTQEKNEPLDLSHTSETLKNSFDFNNFQAAQTRQLPMDFGPLANNTQLENLIGLLLNARSEGNKTDGNSYNHLPICAEPNIFPNRDVDNGSSCQRAGDSHQHGGHQIEGAQEFFNSFETFYKDSSQICDDETSRSSISGSTARSTATADRGIETSPQHRLSYPREFKLLVIEQYYSNGQNKYRTCKDFQITKSMLNGWLQKADKIKNSRPWSLKSGRSGRRPQFPAIEQQLYTLLCCKSEDESNNERLSNRKIRETARELARHQNPNPSIEDDTSQLGICQFSERWLNNFKRRYHIYEQQQLNENDRQSEILKNLCSENCPKNDSDESKSGGQSLGIDYSEIDSSTLSTLFNTNYLFRQQIAWEICNSSIKQKTLPIEEFYRIFPRISLPGGIASPIKEKKNRKW